MCREDKPLLHSPAKNTKWEKAKCIVCSLRISGADVKDYTDHRCK